MAVKRVLLLGDPGLREVSAPAAGRSAADLSDLARDLADTLADLRRRYGFGRGLAAPQIGVPLRVIYIDAGTPQVLVDPALTAADGEVWLWDDCFSIPGLVVRLRRATRVTVCSCCPDGGTRELTAEGGLAELLQHELDHLDGVLAVDHARDGRDLWLRDEWLRQGRPDPRAV